ncbi:MAG: tetratricopeptide repeat protein [Cyclobacteriaceae bacterium]
MGLKVYIFLILFSASALVLAQDIDSLKVVLEPMPAGEARVDLLNRITTQLRERNIYTAVKYGTEARSLAQKLDYDKGLAVALENLGWIYYRRGIYSNAFELSQQALDINKQLGDSVAVARCLNNVGAISYEKGQYAEAINHFGNGYRMAEHMGDEETVVRSLNNVAFSYLSLKNLDSARFYANIALEHSHINRQGYMPAFSYRILGDIATEQGDLQEALKQYTEAVRISEDTDNYFIMASTLHRIGKVYTQQKNYGRALEVLNRNAKIARENGYADELERTYKLISDINNSMNKKDLAFDYLKRHLEIHDSLINQRTSEQLALLNAQFESELKQSQIELLTQESKAKEEELSSQKAWGYIYIGFFIVGLMIAIILYYSNKRIKKVNQQLEEKTEEVGMQAAQLSSINKTKDKLLSIISHDIRSPLSSLRGMLSIAQSGNVTTDEFAKLTTRIGSQLDSVYDDLGNLLQWTQSQLQGLNVKPEKFDLMAVSDDVVDLFQTTAKAKNIVLTNKIKAVTYVMADVNHVRIILRNFISNAIKFSGEGGTIEIFMSDQNEMVKVSVKDDGTGISDEDIPKLFNSSAHFSRSGTANEKGMGVGLLLTKEFVEKNDGKVTVESEQGKGSTFSFTIKRA